ncbi:MAG: flavohemoglobin expression-modulating QEGLA motif protein [Tenacibaculum sp.]|nr:flavohemoglobin expression-modulating QEGLA motif protein [Tenacibaculum sp.]
MTINEIIKAIKSGKTFKATAEDKSFTIKIDRYVPYVCTAIHNGGNLRSELSSKIALNDYERWYEEDPHTADFIASMPITLVGNDSRYEYELNREKPVYEEAWGKKVWKKPLSKKELKISAQKHENYYKVTHALIEKLEKDFGAALVYDIHSYNHKRWDREVPVFNIGVERVDTKKYGKYIEHWREELAKIELKNIDVKSEINDVFFGRGYNLEYITKNFKNTLVLATEISKIYCDEETGEIYPQVIKNIQSKFKKAILNNANLYVNDLTNWKHNDKNMLLDNSITQNIKKVDNQLYKLTKNFELLNYVNPINVKSEKKRFFKSKFTVNPNFKYKPIKINPYELTKELYSIDTRKIEDITIRHLYESVIIGCIDKVNLLSSIGTDKFLYNSLRYFGRPSKVDIRNAEYILLLPEIKEENIKAHRFGVDKAKKIFQEAFDYYGFKGKIKVDKKLISSAMVVNSTKTVLLKEGATFSKKELQYLAEHEIGVHMATTMNASNDKLKVFGIGLPINTRTGEGMAVLSEYLSGNFTMNRLRELALRVIAVDLMCSGADFKECFNTIVQTYKIDTDRAYNLVTRVYRGGGFTKDYLYLNGFSKLLKFWQEGNDLTPLLVGKTSISFYNTILEMMGRNLIEKPKYITKSFEKPMTELNNKLFDYILSGLK